MAGNVILEFVAALNFAPNMDELTDAEKKGKEAAERVSKAWGKVQSVLTIASGAALGAAGGLFKLVEASAASAAAIDDAARRAGVGAREFQRLSFAAQQAGSSPEAVSTAFRKLDNALDAARKGSGPAADALRTLGLRAQDLVSLPVEAKFGAIADKLSKVEDPARKTAIAMDLFGLSGSELIPLLDEGAEGIKTLGDNAERLGIVLNDEAIAAAAQFDDELAAMKGALAATGREIGIALIPQVRNAITNWKDWAIVIAGVGTAIGALKLVKLASDLGLVGNALAAVKWSAGIAGAAALGFALGTALDQALGLSDALAGVNQQTGGRGAVALGDLTDDERSRLTAAQGRLTAAENAKAYSAAGNVIIGDAAAANRARAEIDAIQNAARRRQQGQVELGKSRDAVTKGVAIDKLDRGNAAATKATDKANERAKKLFDRKHKGGSKKEGTVDFDAGVFEADDLFGEELRRLAAANGVGEIAVDAALRAAASSLADGSAAGVARQAALGALGSRAGTDLTTKSNKDPLLSEIFGENVPDMQLSSLAQGASPQVLISTINNTFTFTIDQDIDGAGAPEDVANRAVDALVDAFESAVEGATKTVKLNFVR